MNDKKTMRLFEKMKKESSLKSLMILYSVVLHNDNIKINEIADMTQLNVSTVHRILKELGDSGFIKKSQKKKYSIGLETISLATQIDTNNYLVELSKAEMNRLNNLTSETVHLAKFDEDKICYIGKKDTKHQVGLRSKLGDKKPMYATASGKCYMAYESEEWIADYLSNTYLRSLTENTIDNENSLKLELKKIKENGYAIDNKESAIDVLCISAPIFSEEGKVVAAISISAPEYRFNYEKIITYVEEIKKSAKIITNNIGEHFKSKVL